MTGQGNIKTKRYKVMGSKSLAASMTAMAMLISIMGVVTSTNGNSVNAQMMKDHDGFENTAFGPQEHQQQQQKMINGTINIEQTIFEALDSKVNTSLTQAMTTAENSVGNDSSALAAFGDDQGGYLVYHLIIGTPRMDFYNVMIDPGNGQILATEKVSQEELEQMHLEHSSEVVHSGGGSVAGFPLLIPH
jgi:uncharacterized membrane protein YkoI